jgi:transposase
MEQTLFPMSHRQLKMLDILERVRRRELSQVKAATLLEVTDRTIRNRIDRLEREGSASLIHGMTGQTSNNRLSETEEQRIADLLKRHYPDFGPTFAAEKLRDLHGIDHDPKTIRRIQIAEGLWDPKTRSAIEAHRSWRLRRATLGELIQFDGSYEWWLEDRYPTKLCLLAAIDDATGNILSASFGPHEGVLPVMGFWSDYARIHGLPKAIYLDRFSTYSMNLKDAKENQDTATQFERACNELGIDVIHAHSPQAKGRVERLFRTLQDRLVKELRLAGIRTLEEANRFLKEAFIPRFNERFGRSPVDPSDLHRKLSDPELTTLPRMLCRRETRTLRNDFTIPFRHTWYQLLPTPRLALRPKDKVTIHELPDESIRLAVRGKDVLFKEIVERRTWTPEPKRRTLIPAT